MLEQVGVYTMTSQVIHFTPYFYCLVHVGVYYVGLTE